MPTATLTFAPMFGEYAQPSIYPWGIRIDEPVTTLTDLLIAAINVYAAIRLARRKQEHPALRYFIWYFWLMAAATTYGGVIGHGFLYAFGFAWKLPGWFISMVSITLLERAMIEYSKPLMTGRVNRWFTIFNLVELGTFAFLAYYFLNFKFVEIHTAYGLVIFVLSFSIFNYRRRPTPDRKAARNFIIGVIWAVFAGVFYIGRLGFHEWFNHADVSHTFLCLASWSFYRATMAIKPAP